MPFQRIALGNLTRTHWKSFRLRRRFGRGRGTGRSRVRASRKASSQSAPPRRRGPPGSLSRDGCRPPALHLKGVASRTVWPSPLNQSFFEAGVRLLRESPHGCAKPYIVAQVCRFPHAKSRDASWPTAHLKRDCGKSNASRRKRSVASRRDGAGGKRRILRPDDGMDG